MNSRRLRSAIDAPKLAITITMALPRLRSFENNTRSRPSASRPVRSAATIPAMTTGQPKERGPMVPATPPSIMPSAPARTRAI